LRYGFGFWPLRFELNVVRVNTLSLKNFRNYEKNTFPFDPVTTLIVGPNTSGKSNMMEALYLLSHGKSFKADYDREMIRAGGKLATANCQLSTKEEKVRLDVFIQASDGTNNNSQKIFKVNGVNRRSTTFVGNLNTVLFTPEDLEIITDSPSTRRNYLNSVLSQVFPDYRRALLTYGKVLRQRNKILESIFERKASRKQLPFWDVKLLESGAVLSKHRDSLFQYISKNIYSLARDLLEGKEITVGYNKSSLSKSVLFDNLERDIKARTTTKGPHREDFDFLINGASAHSFGSRGQQRSIILVLKLLELDYISKMLDRRPVLLLDDIFSELDHQHREKVMELLGKQQTIITTADIHLVDEKYRKKMKIIELK